MQQHSTKRTSYTIDTLCVHTWKKRNGVVEPNFTTIWLRDNDIVQVTRAKGGVCDCECVKEISFIRTANTANWNVYASARCTPDRGADDTYSGSTILKLTKFKGYPLFLFIDANDTNIGRFRRNHREKQTCTKRTVLCFSVSYRQCFVVFTYVYRAYAAPHLYREARGTDRTSARMSAEFRRQPSFPAPSLPQFCSTPHSRSK